MAKDKIEKTNAMRILEKNKVPYTHRCWESATGSNTGVELATAMGQEIARTYKTLVTVAKSGEHYVFMIPVAEELDLKKAAKAVKEKSVCMCKSKDLLPLTGYIHGGCSPIGMKKQFFTTIQEKADTYETIYFSAGKIGHQLEINPKDLLQIIPIQVCDVIVDEKASQQEPQW